MDTDNNLHIEILIGEGFYIGQGDLANIYDVRVEAAITTIMDCEDSVAAVDAEDKVVVYRNWAGLMKGDLTTMVMRGSEAIERSLNPDPEFIAPDGSDLKLPGRSLMFVRTVGSHMYTDAVTCGGEEIPEAFLDTLVCALGAKHDLLGNGKYRNSRTGSVYIVKPKMHGPEEVEATVQLFEMVEVALGLEKNTLKIGIMDETGTIHESPDMDRMRGDLYSVSIDDAETRKTIKETYAQHGAMLEPHGAVGWAGLLHYFADNPDDADATAVCLETAHPAKFPDEVRALTGAEPPLPPSLAGIEDLTETYGEMPVDYDAFKSHLIKEYR